MKKFVKILLIVILAIFLLLLVLAFAFKGKIKEIAMREANKSLNAKLEIGGVRLSLIRNFPNVYVGLNDVIITGQGNFEQDSLLQLKSLAVSTSIMDLIGGSPYEIKKITIDGADVRLKVLADGQANWDIAKPSEGTVEEETTDGEDNFRLLLTSLVIKDSRLVYDDASIPTYVKLEGLNHSLSGDLGADFTSQKASFSLLTAGYANRAVMVIRTKPARPMFKKDRRFWR